MAREFAKASSEQITLGVGQLANPAAHTMVAIVRLAADVNTFPCTIVCAATTTTPRMLFRIGNAAATNGNLCVGTSVSTSESSTAVTAADGWVFVTASKGGSGTAPRMGKYVYTSGAWTLSNGTNITYTTGATAVSIGTTPGSGRFFDGSIAAVATFARQLSDSELAVLPYSLAAWMAARPAAMWVLDQSSVSVPVLDWTGGGANQTAITGTSVSTISVPGISYGHPVLLRSYAAPSSAAISTLTDDFDDNTINTTKWPNSYGTVSETGGRARLASNTGYNAYSSAANYSLDSVYVRAYPAAANGASSGNVYTGMWFETSAANSTGIWVDTRPATPLIYFRSTVASTNSDTSINYDSTNHAWWRLRISSGNLLFDTSPDSVTWTNQRTITAPGWTSTTVGYLKLEAHRDNGTSNFAEFDNLNVPGAVSHTASATLAVTASLTAAGTGSRPSTASLAVTATLGAAATRTALSAVSLPVTATLAAASIADRPVAATLPITASLTVAGTTTAAAATTLAVTAGLAAATNRVASSSAALGVTATLAAAATTSGAGASADLPVTATLSAAVTRAAPAAAVLAVTAQVDAAAVGTRPATAALPVTVTLTAAGQRDTGSATALAITATLTASVSPNLPADTALAVTATLAAGVTGLRSASAGLTVTAALSASGTRTASGTAGLAVTVTLTAGVATIGNAGTTLAVVATLLASLTVSGPAAQRRPGILSAGTARSVLRADTLSRARLTAGVHRGPT